MFFEIFLILKFYFELLQDEFLTFLLNDFLDHACTKNLPFMFFEIIFKSSKSCIKISRECLKNNFLDDSCAKNFP